MRRVLPLVFAVPLLALALAGCNKPTAPQVVAVPATPLLLSAEDVYVIKNTAVSGGPAITGSIQPERKADVRAEVPAIVLRVLKENGEPVRRGDILVQLDDTALRDALTDGARRHCAEHSWERTARRHAELYASLGR